MYELHNCNPSYLLLLEFEVRTVHVSYGASYFFAFDSWRSARAINRRGKARIRNFRPNIPVRNSGYSMRWMEQHFPVGWTNPSQFIMFQVVFHETKRRTDLWSSSTNLKLKLTSTMYLGGDNFINVATIMDKSRWDTPRKRPVALNEWVFQSSIFTFRPLLPVSML